jgi:hypothetical protein
MISSTSSGGNALVSTPTEIRSGSQPSAGGSGVRPDQLGDLFHIQGCGAVSAAAVHVSERADASLPSQGSVAPQRRLAGVL